MNMLRPFKFQLALIALLSCKLNEGTKLILKQKVDQSEPDFAIYTMAQNTSFWDIQDVPSFDSYDVAKSGQKQRSLNVSFD